MGGGQVSGLRQTSTHATRWNDGCHLPWRNIQNDRLSVSELYSSSWRADRPRGSKERYHKRDGRAADAVLTEVETARAPRATRHLTLRSTGRGPAPRESQDLYFSACGSTPVSLGPLGA